MKHRSSRTKVDHAGVVKATRALLRALGLNTQRPGLKDTPERVGRFWTEFLNGDLGNMGTVFPAEGANQMVVVAGIRVWSVCEHHLLPFYADVAVGYIPSKRILGLSKFARIAHAAARSEPQVQERLVEHIAQGVVLVTGTENVAVTATGEHLCMTMRGIRTPAKMTTSVMRGTFENPQTRAEFLALARAGIGQ